MCPGGRDHSSQIGPQVIEEAVSVGRDGDVRMPGGVESGCIRPLSAAIDGAGCGFGKTM